MRFFASGVGLRTVFLAVSLASVARADPTPAELASARALFAEARQAEEGGRWGEALTKLKAVAAVKMTPQVRFHLGLCQEHTGQLVEALNSLELATSEASEQNLPTVMSEAKEHGERVRMRVPVVFISVPRGVDAKIEVDGDPIAPTLLSRQLPLNPGAHRITAKAPGLSFSRDFSLVETEERRIEVVLVPTSMQPSAPGTAVSNEAAPGAAQGGTLQAANRELPAAERSSTLGWVAVGAGGALLAGATVALIVRQGALSDIETLCPTHVGCPRSLEDAPNRASTFGTLALVLGAAGVASAATGAIVLLTPPANRTGARVTLTPWVSAQGAGTVGRVQW